MRKHQRNTQLVKTLFSFERSTEASFRAYSSAGLERTPDKREVDGSSPFRPILRHFYRTHMGA